MTNVTHQSAASQNKLYIRQDAKLKQDRIVALCPKEVGWVGKVKQYEGGILVVEDVFIPVQEVSSASVDVEPDDFGIAQLMEEYPDDVQYMRYFGHSHVNMGAYFSGTDTGQIDDWRKYGLDWCINHVQNKKGESKTRFDMFEPFHFAIDIAQVITLVPNDIEEWVKEQLEKKVTIKEPVTRTATVHRAGGGFVNAGSTAARGGANGAEVKQPTNNGGMVGVRQGNYLSFQDGWRREFENHKLVRAENLRDGKVELYEIVGGTSRLKVTYNCKQEPNADEDAMMGRSVARSEAKRAEGNGGTRNEPKLLEAGSSPQTPTASDRRSGPGAQQSGRRNGGRVQEILADGEVMTEAEASELLSNVDGDVVPHDVSDEIGESNRPELTEQEQEDYEMELFALGLGFGAHNLMN